MMAGILSGQATLIDHWNMEEGSGTTTTDSALGGHTGTLGAAATWSTTEFAPNGSTASLEFDGSDLSNLIINGYKAPGIAGTNNRTITAWVKSREVNPADSNLGIFAYGANSAGAKWNIRATSNDTSLNPNGQLRTEVNGGYIIGSTSILDAQWHHIAVVLDSDGTPDVTELRLYVDGVLEGIHNSLTEPINTSATGIDVTIGDDHSNREWNGWIDDVRIYDEALDAGGVATSMTFVPEPSSVALLLLGLVGLSCRARR